MLGWAIKNTSATFAKSRKSFIYKNNNMQQIPLQIALEASATFDNFIVGDNQLLLAQLSNLDFAESNFIYFYAQAGSGRSHLLQAIAQHYAQQQPDAMIAYIPLDNPMVAPSMLAGLDSFDCVCLDNLEAILDDREWEVALFDLYNQLKVQGNSLIIASDQAPANLAVTLPDLSSRLAAMLIHALKPLSEEDKLVLMQKKADERGFNLSTDVAKFLLSRQQRDLPSLLELLDRLDEASLQAKRKLTIPFVKQVLADN